MMFGATPISPNPAECLSKACSPTVLGELAQFQQSLAQAASHQIAASSVADSAALTPVSKSQRAITQASPLGERVLQSLSAMHRSNTCPSNAFPPAVGGEPVPSKTVQPGPAAQSLVQPQDVGARTLGKPEAADNFESMLTNLRDVYGNVIQVSLVSKTTGAVSSSLNKLLSAG
ncbi:nodulation protein NolB [Bradyrhizobium macuxiense]|nr:nodulation protein NolB [Bradyrhizobium macuxiense]